MPPDEHWSYEALKNAFRTLYEERPEDYTWIAPEEPQSGYIDAGIIFKDEIVIPGIEVVNADYVDIEILQRLLTEMDNIEYFDDRLHNKIRVRAGVPCITTLEA